MRSSLLSKLLICLAIAAVTFAVYAQMIHHDFIYSFDDDRYVVNNPHIQSGINATSIDWAFSSAGYAANWHPLTWMSHMLDYQLFQVRPAGHHMVSLAFHIIAALLLFLVFARMTGSVWKSAFVAALFALHPLHVESVAWVAERKDVLSAAFWMLTMLGYVWYVKKPGVLRYLGVAVPFALGLLAKPMLVTLPFVLLLMDYWPLTRARRWSALVVEKIPLFVLSAGSSYMTFLAQRNGEAVATLDVFPTGVRIANAFVSCAEYLLKTVWPAGLAAYYPHLGADIPGWQVALSVVVLIGITVAVVKWGRRFPYLLVGWLWYIITLLPVIGFVQVGAQAMADRYTYIPLIGIFAAVAWLVPDLATQRHPKVDPKSKSRQVKSAPAWGVAVPSVLIVAVLSAVTYVQVGYWRDPETLFSHALAVTDASRNERAHVDLAVALSLKGKTAEAITHYRAAIRIAPRYPAARNNLGLALLENKQVDEAMAQFEEALSLDPKSAEAHTNLGAALEQKNRVNEAISHYRRSIELNPNLVRAHFQLAGALEKTGDAYGAVASYEEACRLSPRNPVISNTLAWIRATKKDPKLRNGEEAVRLAESSCQATNYGNHGLLDTLAAAYAEAGRFSDAVTTEQKALSLARAANAPDGGKSYAARVALYQSGKPYRE